MELNLQKRLQKARDQAVKPQWRVGRGQTDTILAHFRNRLMIEVLRRHFYVTFAKAVSFIAKRALQNQC